MAKEFNVPPVVFPSGGNPNTGPQQRRLPTAPFQPARSANASIPFMSFDIGSSPASTSFTPPQFGSTIGGGSSMNFDDKPPLLEKLGKNTKQIWNKSVQSQSRFTRRRRSIRSYSVHHGVRIVPIARREVTCRDYLRVDNRSVSVFVRRVQYARRTKRESRFIPVLEFDRLLYASDRNVIDAFVVCSSRWGANFWDDEDFRDLVDEGLHQFVGGACFLRESSPDKIPSPESSPEKTKSPENRLRRSDWFKV